ncbi:uncharacterized protein [Dermacentor albipictus]|uniref:uncharacterized protein isoform X2 n=1 Tax=Dermacentor albipictus TaxID=60249 RepID=UPI0031FC85B5
MSSSQPDSSDDQAHASESVEYSGGGGGGFPKRSGKVFLVVGLMSVVVVVIVFLIVGFISFRDAASAQARNSGPVALTAGNSVSCVNPCRSPHFFCHPASEKDEKGCFEPGCACFPEHCHKRCPPNQECALGSPVDYRGCFRPNCKCESISSASPASNCTSVCPVGERCRSDASVDGQGCPLPGCKCEPDCLSPCPLGKRCRPGSPVNAKGCFRPGCLCEPDCLPRCFAGLECAPSSAKDLHGCFLAGCVCELPKKFGYRSRGTTRCISPCPFGKECIENSTRDERGCFQRGCTCEVKCSQRCPLGYRCRPGSPKDIEGCFLYGCMCEPVSAVPASSNSTGSRAPRGGLWPLGDDKALPIGVGQDNDNSSSDFRDNQLVIPHVSPQANDGHRTDGSWHEPSPKESPNAINALSGSINVALDLHKPSLGTAGPEEPSRGVNATDAKDAPLLNSNTSSSTPIPTQFPTVDNASATASAANASIPLAEQTDDDDDDDDDVPGEVGSERSDVDSAQNATLGELDDSESSKRKKSDDFGATEDEQGSPNQGRDSTSKTLEDTLQFSASTSQQAIEGHISSTTVDHPTSASHATGEGTADQHSTPH